MGFDNFPFLHVVVKSITIATFYHYDIGVYSSKHPISARRIRAFDASHANTEPIIEMLSRVDVALIATFIEHA